MPVPATTNRPSATISSQGDSLRYDTSTRVAPRFQPLRKLQFFALHRTKNIHRALLRPSHVPCRAPTFRERKHSAATFFVRMRPPEVSNPQMV